jgi:aspartyl protease family protein
MAFDFIKRHFALKGGNPMKQLIALVIFFAVLAVSVPQFLQSRSATLTRPDTSENAIIKSHTETIAVASGNSSEVRLKPDARGHYVADFKMNGRTVTALVDTGASTVAINKSTARKLGLNVSPNDFIYEANTANGKTKMAIATIREIQIGRVTVRDVEAAVLDDKALDGTLMGMSFLKRLEGFTVSGGDLILKQ